MNTSKLYTLEVKFREVNLPEISRIIKFGSFGTPVYMNNIDGKFNDFDGPGVVYIDGYCTIPFVHIIKWNIHFGWTQGGGTKYCVKMTPGMVLDLPEGVISIREYNPDLY